MGAVPPRVGFERWVFGGIGSHAVFSIIFFNMNNLEKARQLIAPNAALYSPKNECNWVCYRDNEGYSHTYEPTNCEDYCEDCIGQVVEKLTQDKSAERPADFIGFCFDTESSKEDEGFCLCENCGKHIFVQIIWTEQELEHWLSLDENQWATALKDGSSCYELAAILDEYYGSITPFPTETQRIADLVVLYSSHC